MYLANEGELWRALIMFLAHDQLVNQATPDYVNYDSHDELVMS